MPFVATGPYTDVVCRDTTSLMRRRIDAALDALSTFALAFDRAKERAEVMKRAAELLEGEIPVVAHLMTSEMGKTFAAAKGEARSAPRRCATTPNTLPAMLENEVIPTNGRRSGVRYEPVGPILAIMPWNFPLWQVVRIGRADDHGGQRRRVQARAQRAGLCAVSWKTSSRARDFPRRRHESFRRDRTGARDHRRRPDRGRDAHGLGACRSIHRGSSRAQHLKKCVLELGGSDAFVVAASADLDRTVAKAVTARMQNNGQACIAAKRFIVVRRAQRGVSRPIRRRDGQGHDRRSDGSRDPPRTAREQGPAGSARRTSGVVGGARGGRACRGRSRSRAPASSIPPRC